MESEVGVGGGRLSVMSADVDEARQVGGRLYYPHSVDVLGDARKFSMHIDAARLGPVTLGWLTYDTEVQIETGPLEDSYHINIPFAGQLLTGSGSNRVVATKDRAAVYRADQGTILRGWGDTPSRMLAVKIDRNAVDEQLSAMLGQQIADPIGFDLALDISSGHGQQWWSVVQALASTLRVSDSLFRNPMLAGSLTQSLIMGLLLASNHDYTDRLSVVGEAACPAAIAHAREYMHEHVDEHVTPQMVAQAVGLSLRALQSGFQKSLQTTPTRYMRDLRLRRARQDLLAADAAEVGVAEVAFRWGFTHLGRFAGQYREMFGETPSNALRSTPRHTLVPAEGALYLAGKG
ncbi:AraC family transcriptional regulator [Gordonia insulae]|uniref:HTH-type transcriptional activator RhaS n=1 Tax=Gordonia insulae TaxID=2420509 RepID=A0A3G8JNY9_9ACTN|nr:AraC family transcriptional regulator [Gordonia insulae]AZG46807.1 HTH-type transcriptional activator RhaS [Gordonia insulae]